MSLLFPVFIQYNTLRVRLHSTAPLPYFALIQSFPHKESATFKLRKNLQMWKTRKDGGGGRVLFTFSPQNLKLLSRPYST